MEIWFLNDLARLYREREAIRELESRAEWLGGTTWLFDRTLAVEAIIVVGGREYPVRMIYPNYFPDVPPIVRPRDQGARWSSHQYSHSGALCLEWGPDTWHPDVTGSQLLESAYRLLSLEEASEEAGHDIVPSRHSLSLGQSLWGSYSRFWYGSPLQAHLASLPVGSRGTFDFSSHWQGGEGLYLVQKVEVEGGEAWADEAIPEGMRATPEVGYLRSGRFFVVEATPILEADSPSLAAFEWHLKSCGWSDLGLGDGIAAILVADRRGMPRLYLITSASPRTLIPIPSFSSEAGSEDRNPIQLRTLREKSIGIVGLGSLGSKIALSLARMGASRFFLVDEDVLLPENVGRHALDWLYVGYHKVDAVRDALRRIRAGIEVEVSRINLTGQESNAALSSALKRLGQCDIVVDATAEPEVFNLLASVSSTHHRPLVWAEVYAGGIGGMIARSRPGIDPRPHRVRGAYHGFTAENPVPELVTTRDYAARTLSGATMMASDGDVSVVAASAARLAADTAIGHEQSEFPYSIYLLGLRRSWVFSDPFHTIPIECGQPNDKDPQDRLPPDQAEDQLKFLGGLIGNHDDEDSSP